MPTSRQYETAKQQANSFRALNYTVTFEMQSMANGAAPKIIITKGIKTWKFSEPDWDVVIKQLAQLYKTRKQLC
jgi:hypothetical protein